MSDVCPEHTVPIVDSQCHECYLEGKADAATAVNDHTATETPIPATAVNDHTATETPIPATAVNDHTATETPISTLDATFRHDILSVGSLTPVTIEIKKQAGYQYHLYGISCREGSQTYQAESFSMQSESDEVVIIEAAIRSKQTAVSDASCHVTIEITVSQQAENKIFAGAFEVRFDNDPATKVQRATVELHTAAHIASDNKDLTVNVNNGSNLFIQEGRFIASGDNKTTINVSGKNDQSKFHHHEASFVLTPANVKQTHVTIKHSGQSHYFKLLSTHQDSLLLGCGRDESIPVDMDILVGFDERRYHDMTGLKETAISREAITLHYSTTGMTIRSATKKNEYIYSLKSGSGSKVKLTGSHNIALSQLLLLNHGIKIHLESQQNNLLLQRALRVNNKDALPMETATFNSKNTHYDEHLLYATEQGGLLWLSDSFVYQPLNITFHRTQQGFEVETANKQRYRLDPVKINSFTLFNNSLSAI